MKGNTTVLRVGERAETKKSQEHTAHIRPQRRILRQGILVLVVGLLCLRSDLAYALRCGNRLILVGASPAEVWDKCGEPEAQDQWVEYRAAVQPYPYAQPSPYVQPYPYAPLQEQVYLPVTIEEWVYNFGPQRFKQKFRFEDGRLVDIESLGYGD